MEEVVEEKKSIREQLGKFAPFVIAGIVVFLIGISFVGSFFDVRLKVDGQKIDTIYYLGQLIFGGDFGPSAQTFFILTYLAFPLMPADLFS